MIKQIMDALLQGDSMALSACFTEKCRYFDYCPIGTNGENYHIYGKQSIEMFFLNKFFFHSISVYDVQLEGTEAANYLASYNGTYLHAVIRIEKYDPANGLIQEITVRPA